jgi:hypothetical protein
MKTRFARDDSRTHSPCDFIVRKALNVMQNNGLPSKKRKATQRLLQRKALGWV